MSVVNATQLELGSSSLSLSNVRSTLEATYPYIGSFTKSTAGMISELPQHMSWSMMLNVVLVVFVVANAKAVPLIYHLRILNAMRHMIRCMRPPAPITPENLFQPLITSSRSPLMEVDVYGHKNNNTYFTDHDIARTHLLSTLFAKGIENIRGSVTMNGLSGKSKSSFTIPLGATTCSFRKEIKPYEAYDMWTRILSWDSKWIYIVTHFVKKGAKIEPEEFTLYPRQNSVSSSTMGSRQNSIASLNTPRGSIDAGKKKIPGSAIAASAMSKLVFKDGRVTIAPEVMLEASGLLPPKSAIKKHGELVSAQLQANDDVSPLQAVKELEKVEGPDDSSESGGDWSPPSGTEQFRREWTREEIEAERVRGLRLAQMLSGLSELENEFNSDVSLGRHYDGTGIKGVVASLAQLGRLSSYQFV